LLSTVSAVERLTGLPMATFNGKYSLDRVSVPGLAINQSVKDQARQAEEEQQRQRDRCTHDADPNFNRMFDKPANR
jgi:hypothetical protein